MCWWVWAASVLRLVVRFVRLIRFHCVGCILGGLLGCSGDFLRSLLRRGCHFVCDLLRRSGHSMSGIFGGLRRGIGVALDCRADGIGVGRRRGCVGRRIVRGRSGQYGCRRQYGNQGYRCRAEGAKHCKIFRRDRHRSFQLIEHVAVSFPQNRFLYFPRAAHRQRVHKYDLIRHAQAGHLLRQKV